ncbi:hypothetical protein KCP71_24205 [Salmonella enterica subsp. enterica]|nr:hypothetical protein KCP71_24205 [Salmonella enterica subsp. enterica]
MRVRPADALLDSFTVQLEVGGGTPFWFSAAARARFCGIQYIARFPSFMRPRGSSGETSLSSRRPTRGVRSAILNRAGSGRKLFTGLQQLTVSKSRPTSAVLLSVSRPLPVKYAHHGGKSIRIWPSVAGSDRL